MAVLTVFVIAFLGVLALMTAVRAYGNVTYPYGFRNAEPTVLSLAWAAGQGRPIYSFIDQPPFVFSNYNPFFIYVIAAAMKVFGPGFVAPRVVALAFYFAAVIAIYLFVRRESGLRSAGAVAALFCLCERHFFASVGNAVTDYPAIFFSVLGLLLWGKAGGARRWAVAAFVLAFFSKQTSVVAAAAAFISLFVEGKRAESLQLAGIFLAAIAAGLCMCGLLFGRAYFVNVFDYAFVGPFDASISLARVGKTVGYYVVLFLGWLWLSYRAFGGARPAMPALYFLFGLLPALGVGREGAGSSYFFDLGAGFSIVAGLLFADALRRMATFRGTLIVAGAAAVQLLLAAAAISPAILKGTLPDLSLLGGRNASTLRADRVTAEAFRSVSGLVLCRQPAFGIGTRAENVSPDVYKINQLIESGRLSLEVYLGPVRRRLFSLIIVPEAELPREEIFKKELRKAIEVNYRLRDYAADQYFYVPRVPAEDSPPLPGGPPQGAES